LCPWLQLRHPDYSKSIECILGNFGNCFFDKTMSKRRWVSSICHTL
jgi:hypothetical protein